ncbi:MAG: hydroxyethylthiazole kinase [Lachnospiraceae bacterium]|nr:hydroxyethylthiazole kinase [Lachnospiraceae bacterium]
MKAMELSKEIFDNIKKCAPVVHNISNYITATDCANMTLACGGSPTMADDPEEVEDIASACAGSVINMGNTGGYFTESMLRTGLINNKVHHPVVLDPVGAGAAKHRNEVLEKLIEKIHFSIIRGNVSEIKFVGDKSSSANGVDAAEADLATEDTVYDIAQYAMRLSKAMDTVIAISGPIDIVANGERAYLIRNGHPQMSRVTGTGCMLSSAIGVFISANPEHILEAATVCISAYGYAGELAQKKVESEHAGTGSLRMYLMDYMSNMDQETFAKGAKIEEVLLAE